MHALTNHRIRLLGLIGAALLLASCGMFSDEDPANASRRDDNAERLQTSQPAETMGYSPTIETINRWINTWEEPGKLSYVYLQGANGEILGYYILEGLPVSYCANVSPNFDIASRSNDPDLVVPAPAMDGVYYSGSGSCNTYYGFDAVTGNYIEYTAGLGINVLLFDQPMPNQANAQPLGYSTVEDVENDG